SPVRADIRWFGKRRRFIPSNCAGYRRDKGGNDVMRLPHEPRPRPDELATRALLERVRHPTDRTPDCEQRQRAAAPQAKTPFQRDEREVDVGAEAGRIFHRAEQARRPGARQMREERLRARIALRVERMTEAGQG